MKNIKERIEFIMQERGLRAKELSSKANLNETAIRDILKGRSKNPRIDTTRKIAKALNIRHEWLLDGFGDIQEIENTIIFSAQEPNPLRNDENQIPLFKLEAMNDDDYICYSMALVKNISFDAMDAGFICPDNSCAPRFYYQDQLLVKTSQTIQQSDYIFVENGQGIFWGRVSAQNDKEITLEQLSNPDIQKTILKSELIKIWKIEASLYK